MTVSGLMSSLLDPYGAGAALTRVAARLRTPAASPIGATAAVGGGCGCGAAACNCGAATTAVDRVELSPAAREALNSSASENAELTDEQQQQVQELKARDTEVRTHEAAHLAAAGPYASGGPNFEYTTGPDGKRYATGGSVSIDTSPIAGDPDATIRKMQQVRAAALAPADPSGQDQAVAAQAAAQLAQAQADAGKQDEPQAAGGDASEASTESEQADDASTPSPDHAASAARSFVERRAQRAYDAASSRAVSTSFERSNSSGSSLLVDFRV